MSGPVSVVLPPTPVLAPPVPPVTAPPHPPPVPPPGPAPVLPLSSTHKTANDACIKRLQQLQVEPGARIYPPVGPPNVSGKEFDLQTNAFGIEVKRKTLIYHYMVHIKAELSSTKEVVFTKKGKEDFIVLDRHSKCCEIFFHAVQEYKEFFQYPQNFLIYDGQSTLFTTCDLFPNVEDQQQKFKLFSIDGANIFNADLKLLSQIKLEVYATKNPPINFSPQEIGRRTADANLAANNRVYHQILELALNQFCIRTPLEVACFENGKAYFIDPPHSGFEPYDCADVGDAKVMVPGVKKTIKFIEGPQGRGQNNPAVIIDSIKAAFHVDVMLDAKICSILNRDQTRILSDAERAMCQAVIKGLDVTTKYTGRVRHLKIESIHSLDAETGKFEHNGEKISVAKYFLKRWNITLAKPNLNLIVCKERGQDNYYPPEVLRITKNQRVKMSQQTSIQSQKSIKESAVLPEIRQRLTMVAKDAIGIVGGEHLEKMGISVCAEPLQLTARQLPHPLITYQTGKTSAVVEGKWRSFGHYARPAITPKIWAMYAVGNPNSRFTMNDLNKFVAEFINMSASKGVRLGSPQDARLIAALRIEETLLEAAHASCEFVFIITDDSITHLHNKYKVIEREHRMIVQDMMMSKALSVIHKSKRVTLENVINKTNVKLGGTNYMVGDPKRFHDDQLIIGVGLSAPPPGSKFVLEGKGFLNPVVIGFASNALKNQEFQGDFLLNSIGQDTLAPIEDIIKQNVEQFQKRSPEKTLPKKVIVYRSGIAEGAHGAVMAYEIQIAKTILKKMNPNIKLIYIAVTKDHTHRFYRLNRSDLHEKDVKGFDEKRSQCHSQTSRSSSNPNQFEFPKASEMNIPPGILLDTMITHPAAKQFFLNSHTTLQGTARTPCYTVLEDQTNASLAQLEELTYALCHQHQIVTMTTSLPTPLYVANEYAKRGRNLWIERTAQCPVERGDMDEMARLRELTEEMSYKNAGHLLEKRINA